MQTCAACPFRMEGPPIALVRERDVDAWVDPTDPWTCHTTDHCKPCSGAAAFHAGLLDVSKDDLVRFWITNGGQPPHQET